MSEQVSISYISRQLGINRRQLNREIKKNSIPLFEGMVPVEKIYELYPELNAKERIEAEKYQKIKDSAFSSCRHSETLESSFFLEDKSKDELLNISRTLMGEVSKLKIKLKNYEEYNKSLYSELENLSYHCKNKTVRPSHFEAVKYLMSRLNF